MRFVKSIQVLALLGTIACGPALAEEAAAADRAAALTVISCGNGVPGGVNCVASKKDVKAAHSAYSRGLKLEDRRQYEEAYAAFDNASRLVPQNTQFFSAREVAKSQLVFQHRERGDAFMADARREQAAFEYRAALEIDPDNSYTQQRLAEASGGLSAGADSVRIPEMEIETSELHLIPRGDRATFHYRGEAKGLFTQLAEAYGMKVVFDDSTPLRQLPFFVDNVDFFTALNLACRSTKTMWTALDAHEFMIALDSAENHKQFDRMSLATFQLPGASSPQDATELVNSLKAICDFQKVSPGGSGIVEVRAPQATLGACTKLVQQLAGERPQVSIDVEIYQISHNFARDIGLHIPDTFNMYNIPIAALAGLAGQNISSLVNQLISSGGINSAGSSAISGLLAQLQNQSSGIFSQPLATFGNGLTFSGVSLDHITTALSLNESWARSLSRATLRAGQGKDASLHIGERYPILNASYAPISNSPAISAVLGNQSYQAPFPSVSYEDLGLNIKTTAAVHGDNSVSLKLELQVRSLTGASANGVPVIANEEYQSSIRLQDGEPAVVAGEVTTNDSYAIAGIPGLAAIPGLNQALLDNNKMKENDELLIVLTPHVVANRNRASDEIWITQK